MGQCHAAPPLTPLVSCGTVSHRLVPLSLAVVSAAAFGTTGPLAKPLIDAGLRPLDVAWLRATGAAVLLLPVALRSVAVLRTWPVLVIGYGVFAVAGVQATYFVAVARIPVAVALLIEYLGPVLVLLVVRFVFGRHVTRVAVAGAVVTLLGLAAVVEVWNGLRFDALGLLSAGLAAVCLASYFLLSERGTSARPAALLAWGLSIGALVLTVVARPWDARWSVLRGTVDMALFEASGGTLALVLIVVGTVLAYLTGIAAVRGLSAPIAAIVATLEAVVASVLAWALLGETMTAVQIGGGVIVLVGASLAQRSAEEPGRAELAINAIEPVPEVPRGG